MADVPDVPPAPPAPLRTPSGERVAVVHLTAEYYPYARTGGLAEAVAGLACVQQRAGLEVLAIMPLHRSVRAVAGDLEPVGDAFTVGIGPRQEVGRLWRRPAGATDGPPVYFLEHADYFDRAGLYGESGADYPDNPRRFAWFARAALEVVPRLVPGPVILHAHDWHTALAPLYLRTHLAGAEWTRRAWSVLSVHNPGYQGYFPPAIVPDLGIPWEVYNFRQLEWYGQANLLKGGLVFAEASVTVSPTHAQELTTEGGGFGLHDVFRFLGERFTGIINGIDQAAWDPSRDAHLTATYSAIDLAGKQKCKTAVQRAFGLPQRKKVPVFAFSGRLVKQKGLDLVLQSPQLFDIDAQFIFLGNGDPSYGTALSSIAARLPDKVAVPLDFSDRQEHRLLAGADLLLMPSEYEPCGLTQMRAQRYGTLPIVRRVGGLADTVEDEVTGFLFDAYSPDAFRAACERALRVYTDPVRWQVMQRAAMARDFSWERPAARYLDVYRRVVARAHPGA